MRQSERPKGAGAGLRAIRLGSGPNVSFIVISDGDGRSLELCLASLSPRSRPAGVEIVVVRSCSSARESTQLQDTYPTVQFVFAKPRTPVSELRARGMAAAEGDIVVFVDDQKPLPRDWLARLAAAKVPGHDRGDGSERTEHPIPTTTP